MRRQQLTEVQIATLFDPPTDRRELVRHYTLSDDDLGPTTISLQFGVTAATPTASATH